MKKTLLTLLFSCASFAGFSQSWTTQVTGFTTPLRQIKAIDIVDSNTVWALAEDGTSGSTANIQEFTKTTDGGATWTPGLIDIGNSALNIGNISAIDANTAWVSAFDATAGLGGVWKTIDGGINWVAQNTTAFTTAGSSWCDGVHFFDANNGIAFGDPVGTDFEVYTTADGGATWTAVPAASLPNSVTNEWGYAGSFGYTADTFWFATSRGKLYKTADKGTTWTKLNTPLTDFGAQVATTNWGSLMVSDNNNIAILGTKDTFTTFKIYHSTNGGTSWDTGTAYTQNFLNMCYVPNTTTLVATSDNATAGTGSKYSTDNGTTWEDIDAESHGVPAFIDNSTGWSGNISQNSTVGGISKFNGTLLSNSNFASKTFNVFPNPTKDIVTISTENSDEYSLELTDITGKVLLNKTYSGVENQLNISNLNNGVYFISLKMGDKSQTIKIVKN